MLNCMWAILCWLVVLDYFVKLVVINCCSKMFVWTVANLVLKKCVWGAYVGIFVDPWRLTCEPKWEGHQAMRPQSFSQLTWCAWNCLWGLWCQRQCIYKNGAQDVCSKLAPSLLPVGSSYIQDQLQESPRGSLGGSRQGPGRHLEPRSPPGGPRGAKWPPGDSKIHENQ